MNTKLKLAMMVSGMVLGVSGAAFAATGQLPDVVKSGVAAITGSSSGVGSQGTLTTGTSTGGQYGGAAGNQYAPGTPGDNGNGNAEAEHDAAANQYGDDVSEVARDKGDMGTKTLPNGNEVENHGMAVSGAAHQGDDDPATPPATTMPTTPQPAMGAPRGDGETDGGTPPASGSDADASHMSSGGSSQMGGNR